MKSVQISGSMSSGVATATITKKISASGGCSPGYVFSIMVLHSSSGKQAGTDNIYCS